MRARKNHKSSTIHRVLYNYDFMRQSDTPHSFRGLMRWVSMHGFSKWTHVGELYQTLDLTAAQALYFEKKRLKKRFPTRNNAENNEVALENVRKWGFRIQ